MGFIEEKTFLLECIRRDTESLKFPLCTDDRELITERLEAYKKDYKSLYEDKETP